MKLYFADTIQYFQLHKNKFRATNFLDSYWKKKELIKMIENNNQVSLFLDSGAFSAWTQKIEINIDDYIAFIKKYENSLELFANLDSIGNAEKTLDNQNYMESKGVKPLPCFHFGEEKKYIEYYSENYDYIALGGMVGRSKKDLEPWLDKIWGDFLTNPDGSAKIKVHGFGMTSVSLMKKYPWYSVDSTSWVLTGRFGGVFCNIGDYNKINVSNKGDLQDSAHFLQLPPHSQEQVRKYFADLGRGYTIEELMTEYKARDEVNILYFLALEKEMTETPPRFVNNQMGLFG